MFLNLDCSHLNDLIHNSYYVVKMVMKWISTYTYSRNLLKAFLLKNVNRKII